MYGSVKFVAEGCPPLVTTNLLVWGTFPTLYAFCISLSLSLCFSRTRSLPLSPPLSYTILSLSPRGRMLAHSSQPSSVKRDAAKAITGAYEH